MTPEEEQREVEWCRNRLPEGWNIYRDNEPTLDAAIDELLDSPNRQSAIEKRLNEIGFIVVSKETYNTTLGRLENHLYKAEMGKQQAETAGHEQLRKTLHRIAEVEGYLEEANAAKRKAEDALLDLDKQNRELETRLDETERAITKLVTHALAKGWLKVDMA